MTRFRIQRKEGCAQQDTAWVAVDVRVPKIVEGLSSARVVELSARDVTPRYLGHLEIDQLRSV